ncbi:putative 1-acyl-sn-glycerol-3-phosphate acyltransferase 4 [Silene latifolia]|uniref:putative 1-acyl-sn-glycerol-3-phosphate acyltransferase 4 n=1 Tax=Silene latifolia TaxID=37657 RepID=UPI003D76B9B7
MEVCKPLKSEIESKHRPLTPLRILRGILCLVVLLSTAFFFLVFFVPPVAVLLRLFSLHYSRKFASFLFGLWLALWPFLFEKINKTSVVFSGEHVPAGERVLLIANHRTEVDWMYLWNLALRKGSLGYIKYVLKNSLMKLPIFGWAFHIFEFIPVERNWESDEPIMQQMLLTYTDRQDPLWLALFPEGTDFNEQKCKRSQKFAAENGFPVMNHVLLPKTKGFYACLDTLRSSLDAVYDVTIAYKHNCPTLMDNVFGVDPSEVHIHIQRISLNKMPVSEDETAAWLMNAFQQKDKLLTDFCNHGHFPNQGIEPPMSTMKCLINCSSVMAITAFFAYLTFVFKWVRLFIAFSCAYLYLATHFNFRPTPLSGLVDLVFCKGKSKKCR